MCVQGEGGGGGGGITPNKRSAGATHSSLNANSNETNNTKMDKPGIYCNATVICIDKSKSKCVVLT